MHQRLRKGPGESTILSLLSVLNKSSGSPISLALICSYISTRFSSCVRLQRRQGRRRVADQLIGLSGTPLIPDKGGEADLGRSGEGFAYHRSTDADFAERARSIDYLHIPTLARVRLLTREGTLT